MSSPPLDNFDGTVRLFPLPNLVLFPHVVQPLHIFEPRYRRLTADSLASDQLLTLGLLRPGWEEDYEGRPPVFRVACLARIIGHQKLDDGRYNLLVRGLHRVRIEAELPPEEPYRQARADILAESPLASSLCPALREQLRGLVGSWFAPQSPVVHQFQKLFESELGVGALCDIFSFTLPLPVALKQDLLEELDVERRARRLARHLQEHKPRDSGEVRKFPPDFSDN